MFPFRFNGIGNKYCTCLSLLVIYSVLILLCTLSAAVQLHRMKFIATHASFVESLINYCSVFDSKQDFLNKIKHFFEKLLEK